MAFSPELAFELFEGFRQISYTACNPTGGNPCGGNPSGGSCDSNPAADIIAAQSETLYDAAGSSTLLV